MMPRKMGNREASRMMARMGMQLKEMNDITRVIFEGSGRRIIIEDPEVAAVTIQGQTMYQVGGKAKEESVSSTASTSTSASSNSTPLSTEDVTLVSSQAGVAQKEAEEALRQTGGDLAQAIVLLQKKKTVHR